MRRASRVGPAPTRKGARGPRRRGAGSPRTGGVLAQAIKGSGEQGGCTELPVGAGPPPTGGRHPPAASSPWEGASGRREGCRTRGGRSVPAKNAFPTAPGRMTALERAVESGHGTAPHTWPEAGHDTAPHTWPEAGHDTAPHTRPEAGHDTAPHTRPEAGHDTAPHTWPEAGTAHGGPDVRRGPGRAPASSRSSRARPSRLLGRKWHRMAVDEGLKEVLCLQVRHNMSGSPTLQRTGSG